MFVQNSNLEALKSWLLKEQRSLKAEELSQVCTSLIESSRLPLVTTMECAGLFKTFEGCCCVRARRI